MLVADSRITCLETDNPNYRRFVISGGQELAGVSNGWWNLHRPLSSAINFKFHKSGPSSQEKKLAQLFLSLAGVVGIRISAGEIMVEKSLLFDWEKDLMAPIASILKKALDGCFDEIKQKDDGAAEMIVGIERVINLDVRVFHFKTEISWSHIALFFLPLQDYSRERLAEIGDLGARIIRRLAETKMFGQLIIGPYYVQCLRPVGSAPWEKIEAEVVPIIAKTMGWGATQVVRL